MFSYFDGNSEKNLMHTLLRFNGRYKPHKYEFDTRMCVGTMELGDYEIVDLIVCLFCLF